MIPFFEGDRMRLYVGDVRQVLAELPERSVHAVVTSPPYYGLRSYGTPVQVWGGDSGCEHEWGEPIKGRVVSGGTGKSTLGTASGGNAISEEGLLRSQERQQAEPPVSTTCLRCGAWCGELGQEPTHHMFVANMVEAFRAVRRVLRDDGTVWLNLGDTYASSSTYNTTNTAHNEAGWKQDAEVRPNVNAKQVGVAAKNILLIPHRVAIALQDDGWVVRIDNVWSKPGPMPESVEDRPARAHEYVFMLVKQRRYYFDKEAIKEPAKWERWGDQSVKKEQQGASSWVEPKKKEDLPDPALGRNPRSVWTINTANYPEAHFAVFPEELPEKCIKASTSEKGVCPNCGTPWNRIVEKDGETSTERKARQPEKWQEAEAIAPRADGGTAQQGLSVGVSRTRTIGWEPGCTCNLEPVPATVLDPFSGAATTLMMARRLNRDSIGVELSEAYAAQCVERRLKTWWKDLPRAPEAPDDQLRLLDAV